ncbi:MAG: hypothetical protein M5U01_11960 [Ardenticatenaceae bacterium]|nr:hypothetical protein [Ardenticatenaceae bacterium]HBY98735.1 hypothetical protein [Chloroflexota bacterium]
MILSFRSLRLSALLILVLFLAACQTTEIVTKSEGTIQGQGIAYRWEDELWVADITGQNARRVTADLTAAECAAYAPAPNGRAIAYRDSGNRLWIAQIPAGETRQLSPVVVEDFAWYPSSRGLAYSSGSDLYLQTANSADRPERYSLQGRSVRRPTWSPDNSRIAFYLLRDGNQADLAVLPFPATRLSDLQLLDSFQMRPGACLPEIRWAPDGKKLVAGDGLHQFVYFLAGGSPLPLGGGSPPAAWSTDSRRLAYLDSNRRLLLRDVLSGDVRAAGNGSVGRYAWAPNGALIAYTVRADGGDQLVLFDIATSQRVTLVGSGVALDLVPAWSSTGQMIFFGYRPTAAPAGIGSVNRAGGAVQQLLPRASDFRLFDRRSD